MTALVAASPRGRSGTAAERVRRKVIVVRFKTRILKVWKGRSEVMLVIVTTVIFVDWVWTVKGWLVGVG
jgi:hypothetical protein